MGVKKGHKFGARNTITLTDVERSVVVGTLLGDSSLLWGRGDRVSARMTVRNSLAQREFVEWKFEKLRRLVRTPPKETPNRGYKRDGMAFGFSTRSFGGDLVEIKRLIDPGKTISLTLLDMLTKPEGLAAWFMDDGSRSRGSSLVLHTQSMSSREVRLISRWLRLRWGVSSKPMPVKNRSYEVLRIDAASGERLMDLVRPFVVGITCMEHKILAPRESLFCPMCGNKFEATRRQIQRKKRLVTCREDPCMNALTRMTARLNDARIGSSTT